MRHKYVLSVNVTLVSYLTLKLKFTTKIKVSLSFSDCVIENEWTSTTRTMDNVRGKQITSRLKFKTMDAMINLFDISNFTFKFEIKEQNISLLQINITNPEQYQYLGLIGVRVLNLYEYITIM